MKTLDADLLTQAAAAANAPVLLVEIAAWNGVTVRYAQSDAAVTYGGNSYAPRPFSLGVPEQNQEASDLRAELTLANTDLALSALCAAADPVGCAVTLRQVFLDDLGHQRQQLGGLVVDGYRLSDEVCSLTLVAGNSGLRTRVPGRLASRSCPWVFKGIECGYAGADAECTHTDDDCEARTGGSNLANFGGFLFLTTKRWG